MWAYILDSTLERDSMGGFIRSFYWINDFARYSETGEILYFRRSVDPSSQMPRTADVEVLNNEIHLLMAEFRDEERFQDFVDVYELQSGDYLYSYWLPQSFDTFALTEEYLAGMLWDTGELIIYRLRNGW